MYYTAQLVRIMKAFRRCMLFFMTVILLMSAGSSYAAGFTQPYSHYSDRENIRDVLADFARSQGYTAQLSEQISGLVSGRFDRVDPEVFAKGMEAAYGVRYYVLNDTLYFYHESEETRTIFRPSSVQPQKLRSMLQNSSLIARELPLSIDSNGLLVLTGPAFYVNGLVSLAREFDRGEEHQVVMEVFKLKHAKAQDVRLDNLDAVVILPGIASILQRMVGSSVEGAGGFSMVAKSPALQGLRGSGMAASAGGSATAGEGSGPVVSSESGDPNAGFTPRIIADSRLNAVIIQDFKYRMPYYRQVIDELDVPLRLVELHAAIVDIDIDAAESLGVDWRAGHRSGNWGGEIGSGQPNWDGSFPAGNPDAGGIFSTIFQTNHSQFMAQVNMLEEDNKAKTLGKPSVLTLDNIEAVLEDTTTRYVPISGNDSSDLFMVESGTVLRVTPHIIESADGGAPLISMVISLQSNQDSSDNGDYFTTADGNITVPPVKQTRINTQAVVREGQSLLLGGYYVQYAAAGDSGVPVLKDVPVAGGLFGSENESTYTRERLLLITPRILDLDELNVPAQVRELGFDREATQSDYNHVVREPKTEESSGCSSNRNAPAAPSALGTQSGSGMEISLP